MENRCPKCNQKLEKKDESFCPFCGEVLNKDLKLMLDINKILKEPKKEVKVEKKEPEVAPMKAPKDDTEYDIAKMSDDKFNWKPIIIVVIIAVIACGIYFGFGYFK